MNVSSATELKLELTTLKTRDYPPTKGDTLVGNLNVLPLVVVQCPWGDPARIEMWESLSFRKIAKVITAIQAEGKRVAAPLTGWEFDLEDLNAKDFDAINAAVLRNSVDQGSAMIAKYAVGVPVTVPRVASDGTAGGLTADDVKELGFYTHYRPLLMKLQEEASEEFRAGFLDATGTAPARSEI